MNAAITSLKTMILALIGCAILVFALDDTIKGIVIMDMSFVVAYIATIATAWIVFREDGKSRSLLVVVAIMTVVLGAEIGTLLSEINIVISRWSTLSTLPDLDRWNNTLLRTVLTCVALLLIVAVKPSSPKYDNNSDDDNKG